MTNYKWSKEDNQIAQAELELANLLTKEINSKPELSLPTLFVSKKVKGQVAPILLDLELRIGHALKTTAETTREADGSRKVWVSIHPDSST